MKIVFVDQSDNWKVKEMETIPPKGTKVFMGYTPICEVDEIILFPNDTLEFFNTTLTGEVALVMINAEVLIYLK